jgi:hypothetical protein
MSLSTRRESLAMTMEGALSVPPDRGTIIGRAVWKVRFCVSMGVVDHERDADPV